MFEVLPNEIIAKIISYLDKELLLTYKLSKQFKNVCDSYLVQILKEKLIGTFVENISSKERLIDIFLNNDLNVRYCDRLNCLGNEDYIIGNDGKVYVISRDKKFMVDTLKDIYDIISISCNYYGFLLLRNDGYVYDQSLLLICKDIVQVIQGYGKSFFLNSRGKIYIKEKDNIKIIPKLKNIIKIQVSDKHNLFLQRNGNIFQYDENITKIEVFKNVKDLLVSII